MSTASRVLISKLSGFSSCELPHGGYLPGIEMFSPQHISGSTSICGPAFTVKVDAAEPESVMLISAPPTTRSAIWGGLMTARAQSIGVKGVVLDGRCRDISEHRESGFPVFARSHSILGQSPFTRPSELQIPLEIRDPTLPPGEPAFPPITVNPGDLLLADIDGVVAVPSALVERVIELATEGRRVDGLCMDDLRAGKGIKETFALHRGK